MIDPCLIIHGETLDGQRFRPATQVPGMHWAWRFLDSLTRWDKHFAGKLPSHGRMPEGVQIALMDGKYVILVDKDMPCSSPDGFAQLMSLVKSYDLKYEFIPGQCGDCVKHKDCVNEQKA